MAENETHARRTYEDCDTVVALDVDGSSSPYGAVGITIEVLEYHPTTGEIVTIKPPQHWDPQTQETERPALPVPGSRLALARSGWLA